MANNAEGEDQVSGEAAIRLVVGTGRVISAGPVLKV
jgi:hypothetical protein